MIHLTARLRHVADLVPSCQSMADIGTDHAYLPLFLLEKGKVQWAIASDIHKGPLERARAHLKGQEKGENIELRLGGGLSPLEVGEVDGAVMAGMGGLMMRDILEADFPKAQSLSWLVLQPQNHVAELKQYLACHHFMILQEDMAMEDRRLYEMMLVKPGAMKEISLLEGEIGVTENYRQHPLFHEHLRRLIRKRDFLIQGVAEDTDNERNRRRREKALEEKKRLEAFL